MAGPLLLCGAFAALAIALVWYSAKRERERREALAAWAAREGFRFLPGRDPSFDERFPSFPSLRDGSNRYAYNVVQGKRGDRPLHAFDYHYETHSTDGKGRRRTHHHHFSGVIVRTDLPLRPLAIRPEGFLDRLAEFVGIDDIDFESAEFSRRFHVKAPDRRWAYDVIHQDTMEFLLAAPAFQLQFGAPDAIAFRTGRFDVPGDFRDAIAVLEGILARIPADLFRDRTTEGR